MTGSDGAEGTVRSVTIETVRTARYAVIGADPATARRVWFALHGYGQLAARFLRPFDGIVPPDCAVVAPEGLSRFYLEMPRTDGRHLDRVGATWMTREGREGDIHDTVRWLDAVHREIMGTVPDPGRSVGVLGFSQGVAAALRWIGSGSVRPAMFVAWAGGLASDVQHEALQRKLATATVVAVTGDRDPFANAESRDAVLAGLRRYSRGARPVTFAGAHHLDPDTLHMLLRELPTGDAARAGA